MTKTFRMLPAVIAALAMAAWAVPSPTANGSGQSPAEGAGPPPLIITQDTTLDPAKTYGRIVITASDITLDGRGAWLVGAAHGDPKRFQQVAVSAKGVSRVTLKNLNAKGWETGLEIEDGHGETYKAVLKSADSME